MYVDEAMAMSATCSTEIELLIESNPVIRERQPALGKAVYLVLARLVVNGFGVSLS